MIREGLYLRLMSQTTVTLSGPLANPDDVLGEIKRLPSPSEIKRVIAQTKAKIAQLKAAGWPVDHIDAEFQREQERKTQG